jgi:hypothetical protein
MNAFAVQQARGGICCAIDRRSNYLFTRPGQNAARRKKFSGAPLLGGPVLV